MTHQKNKIHIIITGGTIDKVYSPYTQNNIFKEQSCLPNYLSDRINYDLGNNFTQLPMIDSREMDDNYRQKILEAINAANENKFVISHGTDTMVETAKFLQANIKNKDKTIILFGSMVPMVGFYYTDAGFNLGYAMATAQQSDPGVFICMNGQKFTPDSVKKNIKQSLFEDK